MLLILSTQRSAYDQVRADLANENLSGYFQLYGSVFRTFKQARRDLLSGSGAFRFDFLLAETEIKQTLTRIEETSREELALMGTGNAGDALDRLTTLRSEVNRALDDIREASELILSGQSQLGREQAVRVLEGQVDNRIAKLIEEATAAERMELARSRSEIKAIQEWARLVAWFAVVIAVVLSGTILLTLLQRFRTGLEALETGAKAYSANDLNHKIDLPGSDELSAVANRFTDMAQQILIKQQALEKARDDLEQRVAERTFELSEANSALRQRDDLRRQFFADIGHELRTPVTAIRGEAEVALRVRENRARAQQAALKTIVTLSEELTGSVSDLFLIAREQAGVLDFRSNELDLTQAVERGIEQMQSLKAHKSAQIVSRPGETALTIKGDVSRIAQLVRLLIANALQHCPDNVHISVATYADEDFAVLEVADNGPGIPEAYRARIFERYVRVSDNSQSTGSNTGLGLAIAKSITQAHGGRIHLEQGAKGGARFVARFPLTQT